MALNLIVVSITKQAPRRPPGTGQSTKFAQPSNIGISLLAFGTEKWTGTLQTTIPTLITNIPIEIIILYTTCASILVETGLTTLTTTVT